MEIISVAHSVTFFPVSYSFAILGSAKLPFVKDGTVPGLPTSFQSLFDFMEASFSALSSSSHQNL